MVYVNEHGFKILKDSGPFKIEATTRINKHQKYVTKGRLTVEEKYTQKYGRQIVISLWPSDGEFPELETREDYEISRGRLEICIPEVAARRMRLLPRNPPKKR